MRGKGGERGLVRDILLEKQQGVLEIKGLGGVWGRGRGLKSGYSRYVNRDFPVLGKILGDLYGSSKKGDLERIGRGVWMIRYK